MRVGLLLRGDRHSETLSDRAKSMLGPLATALAELGVVTEWVVYGDEDDAVDAVRQQLLALDGVLVWVNPIQDGANRSRLDPLLREVSSQGVWVSAHPDVTSRMGTKEVLFHTRRLGWGTDTELYTSLEDFQQRFPPRLQRMHRLVVKQARGNGGNGVWSVQLTGAGVRIRQAMPPDAPPEDATLADFMERCADYFAWSGALIDQPYQARLADGLIRCYFVHDKVVGFCFQHPRGLLDTPLPEFGRPPMEDADTPAYQRLRALAETDWVPAMRELLHLQVTELPVIWDADFLFGPGPDDSYVLCEINISAVWPFPPQATQTIARATIEALTVARRVPS